MKNTHIKPNEEVPIELRKEVYREALRIIEKNIKKYKFQKERKKNWLCWLLPSVLYDRDIWGCNKKETDFLYLHSASELSVIMFPELKGFIIHRGFIGNYTNEERIEFLKSVI